MSNADSNVAAFATQKDALPDRNLSVIGLFGSEGNMQALVRHGSGRVQTVQAGERISLGRIMAIDASGLLIERRGEIGRLPMLLD